MKTQTSYLLPKDTLDSLRTLAKDVENMSGALSHAIDALETTLSPLATKTPEDQSAEFLKRIDVLASSLGHLTERVAAVESRGVTVESAEPQPVSAPGKAGKDASQADTVAIEQGGKTKRAVYSQAVRRMAVEMQRKGEGADAIISAIQKECGQAPGRNNLPKMLSAWERELVVAVESVAQGVAPSIPMVSNESGQGSSTVAAQAEAPASVDAGNDAPQSDNATASPEKKSSRVTYPANIRKMAVDMRRKGKSNDAIISAIHKKCGYAPDRKFLTNYLNRWEDAIASSKA
ncbi:hypothetical protein CCP4SC76_8140006 [Gammaproteobacteria bacterium]